MHITCQFYNNDNEGMSRFHKLSSIVNFSLIIIPSGYTIFGYIEKNTKYREVFTSLIIYVFVVSSQERRNFFYIIPHSLPYEKGFWFYIICVFCILKRNFMFLENFNRWFWWYGIGGSLNGMELMAVSVVWNWCQFHLVQETPKNW